MERTCVHATFFLSFVYASALNTATYWPFHYYEARTLLRLGVSVRHRHDTYDSIELCDFIKLLSVLVC